MNVYEIKSMAERLSGNTYPGRGIVLGVTPDGKTAVAGIQKAQPQRTSAAALRSIFKASASLNAILLSK